MPKPIKATACPKELSTLFHEHHVRRAMARRHRYCPTHGIRRQVCPICIHTYCVLCAPMHIADHTLDTPITTPPQIIGNGKPLAHAHKKKGTVVVLPAAYNKLVAECTRQKVRILDFVKPNQITVALHHGEWMDDLLHQLGYRVVSMTEFSREKRTIFILEKAGR